jgi:hypothetical protein
MLGIDPELGVSVLRLWVAAGSAILLILFCVLAFFQPQLQMVSSPVRRAGFVVVGAILGAVMTWAFFDRSASGDRGAERRSLELRAEQLSTQVLAPGSPLACLNALASEGVETACEKALFASPANVAAASSYIAAQLSLLSSLAAYAPRGGADIDDLVASLRRSLEADRFGFVAHVLAIRDGCTNQNCKALALLRNADRVRANLSDATLNRYVEHHAALWGTGSDAAIADAALPQAAPGPRKPINIDFPTAASIPAVSIMNTEPSGPVVPGAAAAAASNPNPSAAGAAASPRHTRKQTAAPAAPAAPIAAQTAPSASAAVEPIWPEPVPPPPATQAPQTASTPPAGAPVQLTPPSPNANAGAHTQ